jgi:hypothetical protein
MVTFFSIFDNWAIDMSQVTKTDRKTEKVTAIVQSLYLLNPEYFARIVRDEEFFFSSMSSEDRTAENHAVEKSIHTRISVIPAPHLVQTPSPKFPFT